MPTTPSLWAEAPATVKNPSQYAPSEWGITTAAVSNPSAFAPSAWGVAPVVVRNPVASGLVWRDGAWRPVQIIHGTPAGWDV